MYKDVRYIWSIYMESDYHQFKSKILALNLIYIKDFAKERYVTLMNL